MASSQMKTRRNRVIAYIVTGILLLMSGVSKAPAQDSGGKIVKYHATNTATFKALDSTFSVKIPLHPFFGCIGVAPAGGEARSSIVPEAFGGNMDSPEASAGNTIYFPVNVPGAQLYMGDGHAAMGDGEVAGTAIEVPLRGRLQVNVIKGQKIGWPRFENENAIMIVEGYRPLADCLRNVVTALMAW